MKLRFVRSKASSCGWVQHNNVGKGVMFCIGIPGLMNQLRRWLNEI